MEKTNQAVLLRKITNIFVGTYDFSELAKNAVNLVVKELMKQDVMAAAIFRVDEVNAQLRAYAYGTKYKRTIDKLLPTSFSRLKISLTETDNLTVKTVITGQIQESKRLGDFSYNVLPYSLSDPVQEIVRTKLCVCFPIRIKSGKVAGAMLLGVKHEKLSGEQLVMFETFAKQLGLAFSNVFDFEKLIGKYKHALHQELVQTPDKDDIPSLKFTVRLSPKQNKLLDQASRQKKITKADLLRGLIDKMTS